MIGRLVEHILDSSGPSTRTWVVGARKAITSFAPRITGDDGTLRAEAFSRI